MSSEIISEIKRDYIVNLLKEGKRTDGRGVKDVRDIKFEIGLIETADGSAKVSLGDTTVVCGVKLIPGTPYSDKPNSGVMTTGAELIPMAHASFESGPPGEKAIEVARVVDRGIRESGMIDVDKLCITPGQEVWMCYIDIYVIDYCGNLFDACNLAAVLAIKNAIVPGERYGKGEDKPMPFTCTPISVTSAKIGKNLIIDPNFDEEHIASARLTVTTDDDGNFRAMQKGGQGSISLDELSSCLDAAVETGIKIRKIIG
ncbi:MAG TPA: exosome complex protein Rrp42 [Candidatus Methanomethylophilaceae archaeon]|nr:exosome complex protein Rrp42 [Candidatus Methanomethylophilaceae archaeon]